MVLLVNMFLEFQYTTIHVDVGRGGNWLLVSTLFVYVFFPIYIHSILFTNHQYLFVDGQAWLPALEPVCPSVCLSVRPSVRPSVCLSTCLSVRPSVCLSTCLSVCPSVCLSVCPSVCLSVCQHFPYPVTWCMVIKVLCLQWYVSREKIE